jgi:hypothetical protein
VDPIVHYVHVPSVDDFFPIEGSRTLSAMVSAAGTVSD